MKPSSAKAKGRKHQQFVRDSLLDTFPEVLEEDDVKSTSMGAGGEDILLSPLARKYVPFSIECKHRNKFAIYSVMEQAKDNANGHVPLGVIRQDRSEALAVVPFEFFLDMLKVYSEKKNKKVVDYGDDLLQKDTVELFELNSSYRVSLDDVYDRENSLDEYD